MNLSDYKQNLSGDLKSSIAVALVALPLCLGIAFACGAPLASGVISGILGGIVVGLFSKSHVSVSGPAAGLTVIVINAIQDLGSYQAFVWAVLVAGLIQLAMGLLKAAAVTSSIANSVIKAMLCAIGVLIIQKQLPVAFGVSNYTQLFSAQFETYAPLLISLFGIAILFTIEYTSIKKTRFFQIIPSTLFVVLATTALASFLGQGPGQWNLHGNHYVNVGLEQGASFLNFFSFPSLESLQLAKVLKHAFVIAVVGSIETLLCLSASEKIDPLKRRASPDRELLAQGIGNTLAGLVGAIPITSVIVRTSVNVNAGAKTKTSAIAHGLFLLAGLSLFPRILEVIPLSALSAILIFTGIKLVNFPEIKKTFKQPASSWIPWMVTLTMIVSTDLLVGIFVGDLVHLAMMFYMRHKLTPEYEWSFKPYTTTVNNNELHLTFSPHVPYFYKDRIDGILNRLGHGTVLSLDFSRTVFVDQDVTEVFETFYLEAPKRGVTIKMIPQAAQGFKKAA